MLFHSTYKPRACSTHEDQKKILAIWSKFTPPEGFEIKAHYTSPEGGGFVIFEAATAEAIYEVNSLWSSVYLDYDIVPIIEVEKGVELMNKAVAIREAA